MELVLLKFGGSVITEKSRLLSFSEKRTNALSHQLAAALEHKRNMRCILVHGGGSFGHFKAHLYRLTEQAAPSQIEKFLEVRNDMRMLNNLVISSLLSAGIPACSIPADAIFDFSGNRIRFKGKRLVEGMLRRGIVPVTFGDVVYDRRLSFRIVSGDKLMTHLSRAFNPSLTVFCTDVNGIYTSNPRTDRSARLIRVLGRGNEVSTDGEGQLDVTGSMGGKINSLFQIARWSARTFVINGSVRGRLFSLLSKGQATGTMVVL